MFEDYLPCGGCEMFIPGCKFRDDYFGSTDGYIRAVPNDRDSRVVFVTAWVGEKPIGQVIECEFRPLRDLGGESNGQLVVQNAGELALAAA